LFVFSALFGEEEEEEEEEDVQQQQMSFPQALTDRHNENNSLHKSNQSHSPSLPSHAH
jgi:hypothetical protein